MKEEENRKNIFVLKSKIGNKIVLIVQSWVNQSSKQKQE